MGSASFAQVKKNHSFSGLKIPLKVMRRHVRENGRNLGQEVLGKLFKMVIEGR